MKVGLFTKIKALIKKLFLPIVKPIQWLIKLFSPQKPAPEVTPLLSTATKVLKNPLNNAVSFLTTKALPKIGNIVGQFFKKPELSIAGGFALTGVSLVLPIPTPAKSVLTGIGLTTSGIGFIQKFPKSIIKTVNKLGGFVTGASRISSGILTGLTTASASASLPAWIFILPIALLAGLTLFTVFTSSAAFLPEGVGETPSYIGTRVEPRAQATELAEKVIYILNQCGITYVNKNTWSDTQNCLQNSNLQNKEIIIQKFSESTNNPNNNNMLQCVGFVRGIMASLGKDLGSGRENAKDFLDPPTPPDFHPLEKDMAKVQIGDLVIWEGSINSSGHIAIVIDKIGDQIRVAQAFGPNNGFLQITDINPVYYDGFLRPL